MSELDPRLNVEPYTVFAPKWMNTEEHLPEVRRFERETGFKVYFIQDILDDYPYTQPTD